MLQSEIETTLDRDKLEQQLEDLSQSERDLLSDFLERSKYDRNGRKELDPISIVHGYLSEKMQDVAMMGNDYDSMPPMVKDYSNCHQSFPLPQNDASIEMSFSDIQEQRTSYRNYDPKALSCLLYTSPSPRDQRGSRMPSSA